MTQERKTLAWLSLAASVVACFPSACVAGLGVIWAAGASALSTEALEEFLGSGTPAPRFFGAMVVPMAIAAFVVFALGMTLLVWGARTLLSAPPEQAQSVRE